MGTREAIIAEIETFLVRHNMTATVFGEEAVNDRTLVHRLRAGADVRTRMVDRLREFMRSYDSCAPKKSDHGTTAVA